MLRPDTDDEILMRHRRTSWLPLLGLAWSCSLESAPVGSDAGPSTGLVAQAAQFYEAYGAALAEGRRDALGGFYHPDGALIVFNGVPRRNTRAAIDSSYRTSWTPPAWFAWEELQFDALGPGRVLVHGGFRWQIPGAADTLSFIYAALLERGDAGLGIRFEHETLRGER